MENFYEKISVRNHQKSSEDVWQGNGGLGAESWGRGAGRQRAAGDAREGRVAGALKRGAGEQRDQEKKSRSSIWFGNNLFEEMMWGTSVE